MTGGETTVRPWLFRGVAALTVSRAEEWGSALIDLDDRLPFKEACV
jgi:hypothetical protein